MSIINQALRELDARQGTAPAPASFVAPTPPPRHRPGRWAAAVVLLPVLGVAAWIAWSIWGAAPPAAPEVAQPLPTMPAPNPIAPDAVRADRPEATPPPAETGSATAAAATQPALTAALTLAKIPVTVAGGGIETPASERNPVSPERAEASVPRRGAATALSAAEPAIRHETRRPNVAEFAEDRYRKALAQLRAGHTAEARALLSASLQAAPAHVEARQTLAALLSRAGHNADAETLLREGRAVVPDHGGFALSLARLQAARADISGAVATLQDVAGTASVDAEYHGTLAALLVQLDRHADAASHYEHALRQQPGNGTWWAGLAMSLEAQGRRDEARAAYRRALQTDDLPEKLADFVRARAGK